MQSKYSTKVTPTIIVVCLLLAFGSCRKYLDQQPITSVGPEQVFKDVPTALQALASVYNKLSGESGYGLRLSLYSPVDNDLLMGPSGTQDDRRALAHFSLSTTNGELAPMYNQLFQGIMLANICIAKIPSMDMYKNGSDQQQKQLQRMYGEALSLRAQFYFDLIKNWGDVPAHFQPSDQEANTNPFPTRANRDSLYDHILNDLKQAESLIPWRNEVSSIGDQLDERLTKGAVKGLRARIALYRGGYSLRGVGPAPGTMQRPSNYKDYYQIVRDETNEIMSSNQHALYPDYKGLWKNVVCAHVKVDPQGELMFQVTGTGAGANTDTKFGYANGPRAQAGSRGNSFVNPLPNYIYLFDSTDKRRDVTIAPYDFNNDSTKIGRDIANLRDGKYRRDWFTNPIDYTSAVQYFGISWQLLRYSDVLLMFAEAENDLNGPTAAAYNAVNMVRRRGYGLPISTPDATVDLPAGLSKDDFFKYLVRERALELGAEGIRKYDLIRWNLLGTALNDAKANMTKMSNRSGIMSYSYMAGPPAYAANTANLPQKMYYKTTSKADDSSIWANSYYKPSSASTPTGTVGVNWATTAIQSGIVASTQRYAFGYTVGKSELFPIPQVAIDANPSLKQNPGF